MDDRSGDLVARWRQGDQAAAAELFRRYADRLVALARGQLSAKVGRRVDAEDVVQSVYRSFFADTRKGRYEFQRGGDLWQLLMTITLHKLQDQAKHNRRAKRAVQREQPFGSEDSLQGLHAHMLTHAPSALEALTLVDQMEQLMRRLEPLHRRMFELRLQGYNLEEIASATERTQRTVSRTLERVKRLLQEQQTADERLD